MSSGLSMSKRMSPAPWLLGVLLLAMGNGQAQLNRSSAQPLIDDPFGAYHSSLSKAADSVLAEPVKLTVEVLRSDPASSLVSVAATGANVSGRAAINRVQQLRPILEPILRDERVPPELAAVVLVESGGQPNALSPKGARGLWQFMPDTARRYGLVVTPERDERLDIQRSTRAAARYLHDLYGQFGDWQLAFAAYNAGEGLVQHAIERNGTHDFSRLSGARAMPLETRRYVPAVLDATRMFTLNSAMVSIRNDGSSWRVYADTQPSNGR